jgi:uncharacterized RDD family membrane protein YckC
MTETNPYESPQTESPALPVDPIMQPLASPWIRLVSQIIDAIIILIVLVPAMFLTGYIERSQKAAFSGSRFAMLGEQLLWSLGALALYVAIHWVFLQNGQTIGKRVMSIRIVRKNGEPATAGRIILYRLLPVQLIALIPCLGGLFALVDSLMIFRSERNTLHDDIADTKVIQVLPGQ